MIKNILLKVSKIGNLVFAWFNFFMFFAMRPCWSGISKTLGYEDSESWFILNLPVILWILFFAVAVTTTVLFLVKKKEKNLWSYILNGINVAFFVAVMFITRRRVRRGVRSRRSYWPSGGRDPHCRKP